MIIETTDAIQVPTIHQKGSAHHPTFESNRLPKRERWTHHYNT